MKMHVIIILALSILIPSVAIVFYCNDDVDSLFESNIEVLAQDENQGDFVQNFERKECWIQVSINGSVEIVFNKPLISLGATYQPIVCCVMATDMTKCNFSAEDSRCKQYIVRPGH